MKRINKADDVSHLMAAELREGMLIAEGLIETVEPKKTARRKPYIQVKTLLGDYHEYDPNDRIPVYALLTNQIRQQILQAESKRLSGEQVFGR